MFLPSVFTTVSVCIILKSSVLQSKTIQIEAISQNCRQCMRNRIKTRITGKPPEEIINYVNTT